MSGGRGRRAHGAAYWVALVIGCVAVLVAGYVIYLAQVPEASPFVPQPTFSQGPGGLYDPGTTVVPMPPASGQPTP